MKDYTTYTTAGGGTVTWQRDAVDTTPGWVGIGRQYGNWNCDGCGARGNGERHQANNHAADCRAR